MSQIPRMFQISQILSPIVVNLTFLFSPIVMSNTNTWSTKNLRLSRIRLFDFCLMSNSVLPCKQSKQFLHFPVSHFARDSRLCQLLALCLKCCRPETWAGFQAFFEFQHSNSYKKEQPNITS